MADISDVEQSVVDTVTATLYPDGASQASIVGALCRVYRGWPNTATLNADLAAGVINVTVGSDNDSGRTTTRYLTEWHAVANNPGTTASASGRTITIAGDPLPGDVVGVLVDGTPYAYRAAVGDTTYLVAANLALTIQANRPSSVYGTVISVPGANSIIARVVCDSTASLESRRQEKDLRIICWCPAPLVRDSVAAAVDAEFDQIAFLDLSDGTQGRIIYKNTTSYDQAQNALLYRRDLVYTVEYPTITIAQLPSMLFGASHLNSNTTYG
jgi:hypothetical protein